MKRLAGHSLQNEGAAFVVNEERRVVRAWPGRGISGRGRGLCSCGALSEMLDSGYARRNWHREHKAEVLAEQQGES